MFETEKAIEIITRQQLMKTVVDESLRKNKIVKDCINKLRFLKNRSDIFNDNELLKLSAHVNELYEIALSYSKE